ncbi:MAG: histone deacetylase [Tychonema bourrellyi B0820]|uniref:Histone deacetylase n=1 Tax=Tychonema bourrellyi FEM_GT703 TaxID=2040638 RepID=A0A2G4EYT8_9CYAN|nr:histone deacetylase [Tychonema bourrellyi]MDQ2100036.1 histone deacetylase [Tychonema bourrellyi B0820]PHX54638.1 histone deacetylase [Tychonema bourrellyi FEM_GT703]
MLPVIYSDDFLLHKTGMLHPERPERLSAIANALKTAPWADRIEWQLPTPVVEREPELLSAIKKVHAPIYIKQVEHLAAHGGGYLDGDTPISAESYDVALLAASAWLDGVDRVLASGEPAFVLARPPGHHAESDRAMGFCVFSNAAIAASYALKQPGIQRVAILDWDVHHGNGTQSLVENCQQIAYCSLHQSPCYPGTGEADEHGAYDNVLNIPLYPASGIAEYLSAFESQVVPFLSKFQPDLLIVSAGYDATAADPLASMNLAPSDYGTFTGYCLQITRRIAFGLEGGYALKELAESVVATIDRCLNN